MKPTNISKRESAGDSQETKMIFLSGDASSTRQVLSYKQ